MVHPVALYCIFDDDEVGSGLGLGLEYKHTYAERRKHPPAQSRHEPKP